jgi:diaminopropionate ammonia-lyase
MNAWINPGTRRDTGFGGLFDRADYAQLAAFHAGRPELTPTPLVALPGLAAALQIGALYVKDESHRYGVEAFKIAGVRYAVHRLDLDAIRRGLVCATAGNHGRAVARVAAEEGVPCTVFVPAPAAGATPLERSIRTARVSAMRADGAAIVEVPGSYEAAVAASARHAEQTGATLVSDTSWPGYEEIPRLIMCGYTRLFDEAAAQWKAAPDLVIVQGGVGGLVCAAASWFAWTFRARRPYVVACEPDSAACLLESSRAGAIVTVPAGRTVMSGLRCAEPSPAAWPAIAQGVDAFLAIPDELALEAVERLRHPAGTDSSILAGPSGACGVGALIALARLPELAAVRELVGMNQSTRVLAVVTEGP